MLWQVTEKLLYSHPERVHHFEDGFGEVKRRQHCENQKIGESEPSALVNRADHGDPYNPGRSDEVKQAQRREEHLPECGLE